ncbi:MAG TPA: hypothetical protein VNO50_10835 [Pyrinomonadaceae bacterium]|nr:hypothetical protein [Pyrinomonadaceae bacterium]
MTFGTSRIVALDEVVVDQTIQVRAILREDIVAEYCERLQAGDAFPPIVAFVSNDSPSLLLADGWHRLLAFKMAGRREIHCDVRQGDKTEALKFALRANMSHGIRRTHEDKRKCVQLALSEFPEVSDRGIALMCAVSHPFVAKCRLSLLQRSPVIPAAQLETLPGDPVETPPQVETLPGDAVGTPPPVETFPVVEPKTRRELLSRQLLSRLRQLWEVADRTERNQFLTWAQSQL